MTVRAGGIVAGTYDAGPATRQMTALPESKPL
jgi:hypothetical protein